MEATIYLVEDEEHLNQLLTKYLEKEGYTVVSFLHGEAAQQYIATPPDLWILDIMLPDLSGYELIKAIKANQEQTPVIFMSARNQDIDRVVGLELGSDDYLSKPFLPRELIIRVNKLFERMHRQTTIFTHTFALGQYIVHFKERTVTDNLEEIILTTKEFSLLQYFIENMQHVLSREQILEHVWGEDYFGSDRVVDDTIRRLRKKMPAIHLETIYGFGYKLAVK